MKQSTNLMSFIGSRVIIVNSGYDADCVVHAIREVVKYVGERREPDENKERLTDGYGVLADEIFVGCMEKFGYTDITTYCLKNHEFRVYRLNTAVVMTGSCDYQGKHTKVVLVSTNDSVEPPFRHNAYELGFVKGVALSQLEKLRSLHDKTVILRHGFGNKKTVSFPLKIQSLSVCQFGEIELTTCSMVRTQDKRNTVFLNSFSIRENFAAGLYHHDNGIAYPFDYVIDSPSYYQHESIKGLDLSLTMDAEEVINFASMHTLPYFEYTEKTAKYRMPLTTSIELLDLAKDFHYCLNEKAEKIDDLYATADKLSVGMNVIYLEEINSTGHDQVEVFLYNFRWYRIVGIDAQSGQVKLEKECAPFSFTFVTPDAEGKCAGIIVLPDES